MFLCVVHDGVVVIRMIYSVMVTERRTRPALLRIEEGESTSSLESTSSEMLSDCSCSRRALVISRTNHVSVTYRAKQRMTRNQTCKEFPSS